MELEREIKFTSTTPNAELLSLAIVAAISGCAAHEPQYQEPIGLSVATIDFINETPFPMMIYFHEDAKECTNRTNAGMIEPKKSKTLHISADKELAFTAAVNFYFQRDEKLYRLGPLGGALGALAVVTATSPAVRETKKACIPTIDFLPEPGRNYVFQLNSDKTDCSFKFAVRPAQGQQPDGNEPVAFAKREWIRAWNDSGPFCKKK